MADHPERDHREGPRRNEDFVRMEDLRLCVKKDELEEIVKHAVREALQAYQHACILQLQAEDSSQIRDLVGALKEVGDGDLRRAIIRVRDNHKFVLNLHNAATKIGWGVIVFTMSIMGTLGIIAAGIWKQTGGN